MALDFQALKNISNNSIEELASELAKLTAPQYKDNDDRFWYPDVDKAGNGYAIIRFLPAPKGESVPWVRLYHHSFQGPTGLWYIENSLTTKGLDDPVSEYNSTLWATGDKAKQELVRKQKRKLSFISNVLVIKDPAHPENEGKVFLFRYGKKIFDKMNSVMNPEYPGEPRKNPFDPWNGPELKLKIRNVAGYRNYDESSFGEPISLGDDAFIENLWNQEHSLSEFLNESNFKSYDVLKKKLEKVLRTPNLDDNIPFDSNPPAVQKSSVATPLPVMEDGDDERMDFFRKLANENE